jgi:hypothetical protein
MPSIQVIWVCKAIQVARSFGYPVPLNRGILCNTIPPDAKQRADKEPGNLNTTPRGLAYILLFPLYFIFAEIKILGYTVY